MFNSIKRHANKRYRKNYRFYKKELSNFQTVLKDTNNSIVLADQYGYNCMSYAFGVFDDWLSLRSFEHSFADSYDRYAVADGSDTYCGGTAAMDRLEEDVSL